MKHRLLRPRGPDRRLCRRERRANVDDRRGPVHVSRVERLDRLGRGRVRGLWLRPATDRGRCCRRHWFHVTGADLLLRWDFESSGSDSGADKAGAHSEIDCVAIDGPRALSRRHLRSPGGARQRAHGSGGCDFDPYEPKARLYPSPAAKSATSPVQENGASLSQPAPLRLGRRPN